MFARALSAAVYGIDAYSVSVEVDISYKLPSFAVVGLPDAAVRESRERVTAAITNSGFPFPSGRVTVNLAPADIRKEGSAFDLPIALALLKATGILNSEELDHFVIIGELSLDGEVKPVYGILPASALAKEIGVEAIIVPSGNEREAAVTGCPVYPVGSLAEAVELLERGGVAPYRISVEDVFESEQQRVLDFSDVRGQEHVKRALEIAAAGAHNVLMIGPPGSGKTMLARRFAGILPPLTLDEAIETTKVHSVAGELSVGSALVAQRPFRSPHHTISDAGLIGGGAYPRPGEVSLAHNGVLFLDELPEFMRNVLEVLRQPMEDGKVTIARAAMSVTFPARFMLVGAMNPCPCGYYGDPYHTCTCTPNQIQHYMSKISGPLLDRIDIHIEVPTVPYKKLSGVPTGEKSEIIRDRVTSARAIQTERFAGEEGVYANAHMNTPLIRRYCVPDESGDALLKTAITRLGFSARAYDRVLKLARTIADLDGADGVKSHHIAEAIQYRSLDRKFWLRV